MMGLLKRFSSSSSQPLVSLWLAFTIGTVLSANGTGCGADQACFYWTEAEGQCPSQSEALAFFSSPSNCSNDIVSVDSDGTFDGDVCCYEVTKNGDQFNDCFIPSPPTPGVTTTVGVGGSGAMGGFGGASSTSVGAGGSGGSSCVGCAGFFTNTNPPPLCTGSVMLYEALTACQCTGPCASACGDNICMSMPSNSACDTCMLNQNTGCGMLVSDCLNDN